MFMRIFTLIIFFLAFSSQAHAIADPFEKNNNFMGVHILFPTELNRARTLVNSAGGDWGYVTVPLQAGDKDLQKWQRFMDEARDLHIIPIIRLSTEAHHKDTSVWRKPTDTDILDFANFLNSLSWPTKNRYVILFNEVNRSDEWQGEVPNPREYADLVSYASDVFKSKNGDFFLILGGLDAAAPNDGVKYMNSFVYLEEMSKHNPAIFNRIDGFSSHSYPNPDFSSPPSDSKRISVATYRFEYDYINSKASRKIPVFITETGWNNATLSEATIVSYYDTTLKTIWGQDKDKIVAITPFLLESQNGIFDKFSFIKDGQPKPYFKSVQEVEKIKGEPYLAPVEPSTVPLEKVLGVASFTPSEEPIQNTIKPSVFTKLFFKALFQLH
jgi:hypothetical protein